MKSRDQILLEEAYVKVVSEATYQEREKATRELYYKIEPIARKIIDMFGEVDSRGLKSFMWDKETEFEKTAFSHYSQFCLRYIHSRSSKGTDVNIEFGNWWKDEMWGVELSPYGTTSKTYALILRVLEDLESRLKYRDYEERIPELKGIF
jgi:hypothetical protein